MSNNHVSLRILFLDVYLVVQIIPEELPVTCMFGIFVFLACSIAPWVVLTMWKASPVLQKNSGMGEA